MNLPTDQIGGQAGQPLGIAGGESRLIDGVPPIYPVEPPKLREYARYQRIRRSPAAITENSDLWQRYGARLLRPRGVRARHRAANQPNERPPPHSTPLAAEPGCPETTSFESPLHRIAASQSAHIGDGCCGSWPCDYAPEGVSPDRDRRDALQDDCFDAAFTTLASWQVKALVVGADALFVSHRNQIVTLTTRHAMMGERVPVQDLSTCSKGSPPQHVR